MGTMMNKAAIELTPSSVKLLILNKDNECICSDLRTCNRPNQGSLISQENIMELEDHCGELVEIARLHNIPVWQIVGIATGAMRHTFNAMSIIRRLNEQINLNIQILSENEEASYTWFGSLQNLPRRPGAAALVHIRRESINGVLGVEGRIEHVQSIPINQESLTLKYFGADVDRYSNSDNIAFRKELEQRINVLQWPVRPRSLIISGCTVNALASLEKGLPTAEYGDLHGIKITRAILRRWQDRLLSSTRKSRNSLCASHSEFAENLLSISYILELLCSRSFRDSLVISEGDVSLGVLLSR